MKKYRIKLTAEWIVRGFDERDALKKFILYRRELDQEGSYTFDNMIRDNAEVISEKDKKRFPSKKVDSETATKKNSTGLLKSAPG